MWEDVTIKKRPYETTSIRIDPGIVHLITRIAWEPERTPRRLEEDSRTDSNTVEVFNRPLRADHFKSEFTGDVNPFIDI
jgi:hypothetical protein